MESCWKLTRCCFLWFVTTILPTTVAQQFSGPEDTSVLRGNTAVLECRNPGHTDGVSRWRERSDSFANENGVFPSAHPKYSNFDVIASSPPITQLDLQINNVAVTDEGTYECEITVGSGSATLKVEIEGQEPTITLNSGDPVISLEAGIESVLRCTASRFRPAVNLEWYQDDVKITMGISQDTPTDNGDDTSTTSGTLTFTPRREDDGARLECRTTGQVVAPAKTGALTLNVRFSTFPQVTTVHTTMTTKGSDSGQDQPVTTNVGVIVGAVLGGFAAGLAGSILLVYLWKRPRQRQPATGVLPKSTEPDGGYEIPDGPHQVMPARAKGNQEIPMAATSSITVYESIKCEGSEAATAEVYSNVGPDLAFPRDLVVIEDELGRGAFGRVLLGTALGIQEPGKRTEVAVKTLKEGAGDHAKSGLLEELEVMKKVGSHPNVVKLLGHCKEKDPVYVIVEYLAKGDLKHVLLEYRDKDPGTGYSNLPGLSKSLSRTLVKFARDVANGMAFISSQKCVHRDLAARNVLVGDDLVCKVSDFGLARDVMNIRIYQRESQGPLPMRWMALESILDDVYTTESDVWSFGILLWEIVTLGARPYPMLKTKTMMSQLQQGYRMPKPQHCKKQLYDMMRSCWQKSPKARPTFQSLYQQFKDMLSEDKDYITIHKLDESIYEVTMMEDTNEKL